MQEAPKESELRQVTVMFADISGFTAMSEKMSPEEVTSIMNRCFGLMGSIVKNNEGNVDKFIGDCVMTVFGVPSAIENGPLKAINTAIEIRNRLYKFNREMHLVIPLDIHIGINTGPVLAGMVGSEDKQEYTVMGDTVNLASRLGDSSEKGQILVGPATYSATKNDFDYGRIKPITLKGKEKPIQVFEVLSRKQKTHQRKIGSRRMIQSAMVGRDDELNKLKLQIEKVVDGKGGIVSIVGEAGIGKSRLITELKNVEGVKKATILVGRALSIGRNLSFHPITNILKNWAGIGEADTEAGAMNKLESAIKNVHPKEADEIFPFVATLMGMKPRGKHAERVKGIEGDALEKLILKNMKVLLTKASEIRPLIFIIEDFHWTDFSSLELMESLFRLAESQRILFINVLRPGYAQTGDKVLVKLREEYHNCYIELYLHPLNANQSDLLIDNLLNIRGLPDALRENIKGRSEGNPFFIEEVVRSLIDEDIVKIENGNFTITDKADSVLIPDTIQELLMSRIDRLDRGTKSLLKIASVIGRNFFYKILTEVAGAIQKIDERIEYLKEIQLIKEGKRMEEIEYLFNHALVQEAAYESILLQKRKELHLKVAGAIECVFLERLYEFYGMLAYHYSCGDDLDKAEMYLIKAGEEALKSSGSSEALYYYKEALNIYRMKYGESADPGRVAMLEKNIALSLYNRGQYVEAVEYFDKALTYYWGRLPKHPILSILKFLSGFFHLLIALYLPFLKFKKIPTERDNDVIIISYKKLQALVEVDAKRYFMESFYLSRWFTNFDLRKLQNGIAMFASSSCLFSFTGISFRLSRKILDSAMGKFSKSDARSKLLYDLSRVMHNFLEGEWKETEEYDDNLVNKNIAIGEFFTASNYIFFHGLLDIYRGNSTDVIAKIKKLHDIGESYENDLSILLKHHLSSYLFVECRKLNDAIIEIDDWINFMKKAGFESSLIYTYSCKFYMHLLLEDIEEAEEYLQYAKKLKHQVDTVPLQLSTLYRSQFEYHVYRLEESLKTADKPLSSRLRKKAVKSGKMLVKILPKAADHRTESFKLMGIYCWLINKQKKALKWWTRSIMEGERLDTPFELSRTYFEVGKRLLESKSRYNSLNGIRAEEYLEKANVIFEEMNLNWDLDELRHVSGS